MKYKLILLIILLKINPGYSQCTLDIGPDQYFCASNSGTSNFQIGNNIQINNGPAPYSFSWEAHYTINLSSSTLHLYASDFLDDTTSANPAYSAAIDNLQFVLTVTDSNGNSCKDSMTVFLSQFTSHLATIHHTINKGDSVFLSFSPNIIGGIGPSSYLWRPNHGLQDSTLTEGFWAKPDSSISYYLTQTDSVGCKATAPPLYFIDVNPIHLDEIYGNLEIDVFPNPTSGYLKVNLGNGLDFEKIWISDLMGQIVFKSSVFKNQEIDISHLTQGFYFLNIQVDNDLFTSKIEKL